MPTSLKKGSQGPDVTELQKLLLQRGYPVTVDGVFGTQTYRAVRAFQSQNLDQHAQPLVVDGQVGPLTWLSLTHLKPDIETPTAIDFRQLPPEEAGGSQRGRSALEVAIGELASGAGEVGGDNRGPFVRKYLNGMADEGSSWCAGFVSFCFSQNSAGIPFPYTVGARDMLKEFRDPGVGASAAKRL